MGEQIMRCNNIEIEMKVPIPVMSPDGNNNLYTEEAIINATKNCENIPLTRYDDKEEIVIGHTTNVNYKDGYVYCKAIIYAGGFCSSDVELIDNVVTKMRFTSMGFDRL